MVGSILYLFFVALRLCVSRVSFLRQDAKRANSLQERLLWCNRIHHIASQTLKRLKNRNHPIEMPVSCNDSNLRLRLVVAIPHASCNWQSKWADTPRLRSASDLPPHQVGIENRPCAYGISKAYTQITAPSCSGLPLCSRSAPPDSSAAKPHHPAFGMA